MAVDYADLDSINRGGSFDTWECFVDTIVEPAVRLDGFVPVTLTEEQWLALQVRPDPCKRGI